MNPNQQSQSGGFTGTPNNNGTTPGQREAASNVIRAKLDALYDDTATTETPQQATDTSVSNPYQRTHTPTTAATNVNQDQWKEYHSAWQEYYQKYYSAYYEHQDTVKETRRQELERLFKEDAAKKQAAPTKDTPTASQTREELTNAEALQELRASLLEKVKTRAEKVRKSKHFIPLIAALGVMILFVFIQYNRVFIATVSAYVSPGAIDAQNIVINPTSDAPVGPDPRLIIPKINVDVPVVYGIGPDHNSQMAAMEKGVAHFSIPGANSKPGEKGNTVLSGHSSNDLFDRGDYKFIFAQLEKLNEGDSIYANYEGKRYTYVVTKKEVVKPTQVDKLIYPTDKPILTLITCTPLGTSLNRLLITAEQVSPSPTEAKEASNDASTSDDAAMPGNSATLLERLFGKR